MENIKKTLSDILTKFLQNFGLYTTIIIILSYHLIFNKDFACTCQPQEASCFLYLFVPSIVIWILLMWMDKHLHRACCKYKLKCSCCSEQARCHVSLCTATIRISNALIVSLIWMVSVLLDGDWLVCCQYNGPKNHTDLPCKPSSNLTPEEVAIVGDLKNRSRNIAMFLLLGMLVILTLISYLRQCCNDKDVELSEVILEEEESLVMKGVKKAAEKKMNKELETLINRGDWQECYRQGYEVLERSRCSLLSRLTR